jgi:hypothetical protein
VRVARDKRERLATGIRGQHARARAGCRDARHGEPAAELDHAQAAQRQVVQLARQRLAAAPQNGPVRRERRPLDSPRVRQLSGFLRLQQTELAARQLDRLADELVVHRAGL